MTNRSSVLVILLLLSSLASAGNPPSAGCESTARALHRLADVECDARFWLRVARCANEPQCPFLRSWNDALSERRAARALALEQLSARIAVCDLLGAGPYAPDVDPSELSPDVTNPYSPLVPGRTLVYEKRTKRGVERVEATTSARVVEIAGVACREVEVVETLSGELVESTREWFAQHRDGSVWYFGESSLHYDGGFLRDLAGSWRAGVEGARPGVLVPGTPLVGAAFRRELAVGAAEDVARVVATGARTSVPFGDFSDAVEIEEWSPLEPLELLIEILVPGIGLVAEVDPRTGERLELVDVIDAGR